MTADPVPLLRALVRCPSVTPEDAGVLDVLEAALAPMGFAVRRLRFDGDGSYPVDNLFATRGRGGKHLLFAGHADVVPPGDGWTMPPYGAEERGGRIYGRGAADMKSGIAAFVAALAQAPASGTISLLITNDEEADAVNGTEKVLAWAVGEGLTFDFAIVGEPSGRERVGDSIKVGRRGSLNGRIVVEGVQGHVAYPEKARNPLPVMAAIVRALSGGLDGGNSLFPPSNLEFTSVDVGNPITNVIPAKAEARFNVRFNDGWTPESLEAALHHRMDAVPGLGDCRAALEVVGRPSRSFLSPQGEALELLCTVIEQATGRRPELSTAGGTSDGRFIARLCPVVELGLPGTTMHKADENVRVEDVRELSALYAAFIGAYLR